MPKRKADHDHVARPAKSARTTQEPTEPTKIYETDLERIIGRGRELVADALRLCQRFERQKLGRRARTAKDENNQQEIHRIDQEIKAANALDVTEAANRHIRKILLKIKSISASGKLPASITEQTFSTWDEPTLQVTARLYNTKQVKEAIDWLVESVRRDITTTFIATVTEPRNTRTTSQDESSQQPQISTLRGSSVTIFDDPPVISNEFSKETSQGDIPPIPSEEEAEKRIPPRPDVDILSTVSGNPVTATNQIERAPSLSPPLSPLPSESSEEQLPSHAAFKTSTFLPSLTEAGYLSGSDSEAPDINNEVAPRKNRRGQQARRLIAERKFGDSARHLQNEKRGNSARDKGWDARRGAVSYDTNGRTFKGSQRLQFSQPSAVEVQKLSEKNRGKDDSGSLHPSWIAKKIAKAKEKASATKFAGKKIVFD